MHPRDEVMKHKHNEKKNKLFSTNNFTCYNYHLKQQARSQTSCLSIFCRIERNRISGSFVPEYTPLELWNISLAQIVASVGLMSEIRVYAFTVEVHYLPSRSQSHQSPVTKKCTHKKCTVTEFAISAICIYKYIKEKVQMNLIRRKISIIRQTLLFLFPGRQIKF